MNSLLCAALGLGLAMSETCETGNQSACVAEDSAMMQLKSQDLGAVGDVDDHRKFFATPEIVAEWVRIKYDDMRHSGSSKDYDHRNCTLTGLKICNENVAKVCKEETIFTTVPRWAYGVPHTLNYLEKTYGGDYVMKPWPSAEAQEIGDCSKIQYVQSMEIAPDGVMWVIDAGHKYMSSGGPGPEPFDRSVDASGQGNGPDGPDLTCPPKMVLIDIPTGKFIQTYVFPDTVVGYTAPNPFFGTFLNDIVIDTVKQVAYISDLSGPEHEIGGIIVYDRNGNQGQGRSRRFHDSTTAGEPGYEIIINGVNYTDFLSGAAADGIGLSPDRKWVYYAKLGDPNLYKTSADALSDFTVDQAAWHAAVAQSSVLVGEQNGIPDGITIGENGMVFSGSYNHNGIDAYNVSNDKLKTVAKIRNKKVTPWVDTFAWDNKGYLWMTSNKLNKWFLGAATGNTMDFSGKDGSNFKVLKTWVGTNSYICGQEGVECGPKKRFGKSCTFGTWSAWSNCYRVGNLDDVGKQWRTRTVTCQYGYGKAEEDIETQTSKCTPMPLTCPSGKALDALALTYEPQGMYSDVWGKDGRYGLNPYPTVATGVLVDATQECGVCYEGDFNYLSACLVGGRPHHGNTMQWPYINSPVVDMAIQFKPTVIPNTTCKQMGYKVPIGNPAFYYKMQINLFSRFSQERWSKMYPSGDERMIACDVNCWWDTVPECNTLQSWQPNLAGLRNFTRFSQSLTQSAAAVSDETAEAAAKKLEEAADAKDCKRGCTCGDWSAWSDCITNGTTRYGTQTKQRNVTCSGATKLEEATADCATFPVTCRSPEELDKLAEQYEPWGLYSDQWGIYDGRWGQNPYPTVVEGVLIDEAVSCGVCYESTIEYLQGCLVGGRENSSITGGHTNWPFITSPVIEMAIPSQPKIIRNTTCKELGFKVPIGNPAFYYRFQANLFAKFSQDEWSEMYPSGDQRIIDCDVNCWWETVPQCNELFQAKTMVPLYSQP